MADIEEQERAMNTLSMWFRLNTKPFAWGLSNYEWLSFRQVQDIRNRISIHACLVSLLASILLLPCAHAADFGRLFFTPAQRKQLDYDYTRNVTAEDGASAVVTVNGIIQRRGGGRVVWINGVAQPAGKSDERHPTSVPVSVPGKSRPVEMKVGQKLLLETPESAPDNAAK